MSDDEERKEKRDIVEAVEAVEVCRSCPAGPPSCCLLAVAGCGSQGRLPESWINRVPEGDVVSCGFDSTVTGRSS